MSSEGRQRWALAERNAQTNTRRSCASCSAFYPHAQAIYLFGSYGTADEWPTSDVDIALLLPPEEAKRVGWREIEEATVALGQLLGRDVDLINLRQVSTVFRHQIVMTGRRLYCANVLDVEEFELLTMALYQKLNQERAEILAEGLRSGRFYDV